MAGSPVKYGLVIAALVALGGVMASPAGMQAPPPVELFLSAANPDKTQAEAALKQIGAGWHHGYASMVVDLARFLPPLRRPRTGDADSPGLDPDDETGALRPPGGEFPITPLQLPGADIRQRLITFLQRQTGQRFGDDLRAWRKWYWAQPANPHPDYAVLKAELYGRIDPRMRAFFPKGVATAIRLDEMDWGGVPINGIPPLRQPKTTSAAEASSWLRDNHVVFGIEINGQARAYPKRILAWHEMAIDRLGDVDLTIVYCTLCGTVIPYESTAAGRHFRFGTSGLLYRSNKLMFDEETASLWSALEGVPVVGPLVGSGIRLPFHAVVTTTWGEWKREHPSTTVLSLDTGFKRDYSEGAAYRDYFSHDRLMFEVPATDSRLKNKAEVVVLRPGALGAKSTPLAIAADTLRRAPVFSFEHDGQRLVAITSAAGANRVYHRRTNEFTSRASDGTVADNRGGRWRVTPAALVSTTGETLPAVPTHRVFWFGWVAQHPTTALIR